MNKKGWYTLMVTRTEELSNKNSELTEHMQRMVDTVDDIVQSLQRIERHECSEEAMERIQDAIVDLSVFL